MPSKRYRLLQNHPYAKAGTIVVKILSERSLDGGITVGLEKFLDEIHFDIPYSVEKDWLEAVEEEITFTREQNSALREQLLTRMSMFESFFVWLDAHTSKQRTN